MPNEIQELKDQVKLLQHESSQQADTIGALLEANEDTIKGLNAMVAAIELTKAVDSKRAHYLGHVRECLEVASVNLSEVATTVRENMLVAGNESVPS